MQYAVLPYEGEIKALADRCMAAGQGERMIPLGRGPLTDRHRVIVGRRAVDDGYIIGGVAVIQQPDDWNSEYLWLDILYVFPEFRRQGVGLALIEQVRQLAREEGYTLIGLGTTGGNEPMMSLVRASSFGSGLHYFYEDIRASAAETA